jgi:hypothetical protein
MMPEEAKIRFTRLLVIIGSSFLLGGRFRMAGSGDSTPNDCATGPSHIISKLKVYTYPQYLHCVQGVVKPDKSGYRNQQECGYTSTKLKSDEVGYIIVNVFAFFDCWDYCAKVVIDQNQVGCFLCDISS